MTQATAPRVFTRPTETIKPEWRPAAPDADVDVRQPITNVRQAMALAAVLHNTSMFPAKDNRAKPTVEDIAAKILAGGELGMLPMKAAAQLHVIDGKVVIPPGMELALARKDPMWDESGFSFGWEGKPYEDGYACAISVKRKDAKVPILGRFSIADAIQAGLLKREPTTGKVIARSQQGKPLPWELYTNDLLFARCGSRLFRRVFESLSGVYNADEMRLNDVLSNIDLGDEPKPFEPAKTAAQRIVETEQAKAAGGADSSASCEASHTPDVEPTEPEIGSESEQPPADPGPSLCTEDQYAAIAAMKDAVEPAALDEIRRVFGVKTLADVQKLTTVQAEAMFAAMSINKRPAVEAQA